MPTALPLGDLLQFIIEVITLAVMIAGYCFREKVFDCIRSAFRGFRFLLGELGQGMMYCARSTLRRLGIIDVQGKSCFIDSDTQFPLTLEEKKHSNWKPRIQRHEASPTLIA